MHSLEGGDTQVVFAVIGIKVEVPVDTGLLEGSDEVCPTTRALIRMHMHRRLR